MACTQDASLDLALRIQSGEGYHIDVDVEFLLPQRSRPPTPLLGYACTGSAGLDGQHLGLIIANASIP
eukprot:6474497-Amphidinium_carterae.1